MEAHMETDIIDNEPEVELIKSWIATGQRKNEDIKMNSTCPLLLPAPEN